MLPQRKSIINIRLIFGSLALLSLASWIPVALASQPVLTKMKVATLANQLAKNRFPLAEYESPRLDYEVKPGSDTWSAYYELKRDKSGVVAAGGWFLVLVNDKTKTVRFNRSP